jgi:hypothetical protein
MSVDVGNAWPMGMRLDCLLHAVTASLEVRDVWRRQVATQGGGLEFLVSGLVRWPPGSTLRVAFLDGGAELHAAVEQATRQITDAANVSLDFGYDTTSGKYRQWHEADINYTADIRVSFDCDGYWSLVGTDSRDRTVGASGEPDGGRPGQRSLNLGGFKVCRPAGWEGIVRHEFLHALGFHHEHQNLRGPCQNLLRWADDPGYLPTRNAEGVLGPDYAGRRPGVYTYLAGAPNYWSKGEVNENLRTLKSSGLIIGEFDHESIMLYRFEAFLYKFLPNDCMPVGDGIDLSVGDRDGLQRLYPCEKDEASDFKAQAHRALRRLDVGEESSFAGSSISDSPYLNSVIDILKMLVSRGG